MRHSKESRFLMAFYPGALQDLPVTSPAARDAALAARRGGLGKEALRRAYETDVFLCAKLLSIANSSFYTSSHAFCFDVVEAIDRVGADFAVSLLRNAEIVTAPEELAATEEFWTHSMMTAEIAKQLSKEAKEVNVPCEAVYWVALVHDIGALIEATFERRRLVEVLAQFSVSDLHSDDHCGLAYSLAQHWGMPPWMREVLRWHHEPEKCTVGGARPLIALLQVAHMIAHEDESVRTTPEFDRSCIMGGVPIEALNRAFRLKRSLSNRLRPISNKGQQARKNST